MKLALAQFNPTVGDLAANADSFLRFVARAEERRVDLTVFPELALSGYPPLDLVDSAGYLAANSVANMTYRGTGMASHNFPTLNNYYK